MRIKSRSWEEVAPNAEAIRALNSWPFEDGSRLTVKKKGPPKSKGEGKGDRGERFRFGFSLWISLLCFFIVINHFVCESFAKSLRKIENVYLVYLLLVCFQLVSNWEETVEIETKIGTDET